MGDEKSAPKSPPPKEEWQDQSLNEFLARLQRESRMQAGAQNSGAINQLTVESDSEESIAAELQGGLAACPACGSAVENAARFCGRCGIPLARSRSQTSAPETAPGTHHYHHHYHHHYFGEGGVGPSQAVDQRSAAPVRELAPAKAPLTGPAISRAEAAVRKVTQDWALACNTRQLDDLVSLYIADALVLRPNVAPVRGTPAIREFFFSLLDGGFGEVEMEPLRVELLGEVAYEAGRCKSLVPIAMGKRREERGKYLIMMVRQASGDWRITADSWSNDLSLAAPQEVPPKPAAAVQPQRTRK
jgi:ketosteroid isomerase-like protein